MTTRRDVLRSTAVLGGTLLIPSWMRAGFSGYSPNAQINIGVIGTGKQANGLFSRCSRMPEARFVAACDVYEKNLSHFNDLVTNRYAEMAGGGGLNTALATYTDYRRLLDHPGLDAVLITTPDHQHAQMCIDALARGLHVYCEKPLAHTVEEGRAIVDAVGKSGKVLQTGSMQRSMRSFQRAVAIIQAGEIGELKEAIVSIGPPPKPYDLPEQAVPEGMDWQAWVGPSVVRPFNEQLAPGSSERMWPKWRDYAEYGGGMIADWGAHMFDIVQWAAGKDDTGPTQFFPPGGDAQYGLTMFYDDGFRVEHRQMGRGNTVHFVGSEGTITVARHFIESSLPGLVGYNDSNEAMTISPNVHHFQDFYDAILKGTPLRCPAETGHRTSSICNLSNIAYRLRRPLRWDPVAERITNDRAASKLLGPAYRMSLG